MLRTVATLLKPDSQKKWNFFVLKMVGWGFFVSGTLSNTFQLCTLWLDVFTNLPHVSIYLCICICIFVYLCSCICIFVLVYLCIYICVFLKHFPTLPSLAGWEPRFLTRTNLPPCPTPISWRGRHKKSK